MIRRSGKKLWVVNGPSEDCVATPVFNEGAGLVLSCSSWPKRVLIAIKPDGEGNVTSSKVAWTTAHGAPYVPSPISVGPWFMTASFADKAGYCFDAATGGILWHETMGLHHASPVTAEGRVYFLNDEGVMHVIKAGPKFELVASNELGEKTYASPAISAGRMFFARVPNLYYASASQPNRDGAGAPFLALSSSVERLPVRDAGGLSFGCAPAGGNG